MFKFRTTRSVTAVSLALAMCLSSLPQVASQANALPMMSRTAVPITSEDTSDIVKVRGRGRHGGRHHGYRRHGGYRRHHGRHHRRHHRHRRDWETGAAIIAGGIIIGSLIEAESRRRDREYDDRRYHRHRTCRNITHTHGGYRHRHSC